MSIMVVNSFENNVHHNTMMENSCVNNVHRNGHYDGELMC